MRPSSAEEGTMGNYDGGKLKAAEDVILEKIADLVGSGATTPGGFAPTESIKGLADAFSLLENATKK